MLRDVYENKELIDHIKKVHAKAEKAKTENKEEDEYYNLAFLQKLKAPTFDAILSIPSVTDFKVKLNTLDYRDVHAFCKEKLTFIQEIESLGLAKSNEKDSDEYLFVNDEEFTPALITFEAIFSKLKPEIQFTFMAVMIHRPYTVNSPLAVSDYLFFTMEKIDSENHPWKKELKARDLSKIIYETLS